MPALQGVCRRCPACSGFPKQGHAAPAVSYRLITPLGMPSLPWPARPPMPRISPSCTSRDHAAHLLARHIHMQVPDAHGAPCPAGSACGVRGLHHALSLAADHQLRKFHNAGLLFFARGGQLAVAQDRDRISGGHHLVQTVGDEDDGDAVRSNLFHHGDQLRRLALGQHGRGLVKHKQLYAGLVDFAGDLNKLHVAHRHALDQRVLVDAHAHAVQRLAGVLAAMAGMSRVSRFFPKMRLNRIGMRDFAVELDILRDGEARQKHEFLVHHADALRSWRRCGEVMFAVSPSKSTSPVEAAGGMNHGHAKQHVHQRALSRAVFAQQRMDFARAHRQRNVAESTVFSP